MRTGPGQVGDTIVAEVGAGARWVAVGKGIIQIGELHLPVLPLALVLVALVVGAAALAWWLLRGPTQMSGLFNVAVAEFGRLDSAGQVQVSTDGKNLSRWVYDTLRTEYQSWPLEFHGQVWHDSMDWRTKGATIGTIQGDTPEARASAAADRAEQIRAHVVIYGNLVATEAGASFAPEFYVDRVPGQAEEILGPHQLGKPIAVRLPIDLTDPVNALRTNPSLSARTRALAGFTQGLLYELAGRPEDALRELERAEQPERDWPEREGKEVLYLFKGRAQATLGRDDDAAASFRRALAINPDYARAHIGLGNLAFHRAEALPPAARLDTPDLGDAIAEYRLAYEAAPRSAGYQIETKAAVALGGATRLEGEAYLHRGEIEAASSRLDAAIGLLEGGLARAGGSGGPNVVVGFLWLGTAYHEKGHALLLQGDPASRDQLERAIAAYDRCLSAAGAALDPSIQDVQDRYCAPYRRAAEQALTQLPAGGP